MQKLVKIENKICFSAVHDHDNCIATQEFNKLTAENITTRPKKANLASKNDIAKFVKKIDFD